MADVITDTGALAADIVPLIIKEKLLSIAEKQTVFFEIGDKENLPEGNGKTIQFTRYERLSLPSVTLSEGTPPSTQALTTSVVQAVVDQWGAVVSITDVAQMTVKHPVLRIAQERLGLQHSELVDREIQKTLMGGSNVYFANQRASRSALVLGDNLATDDVRRMVANLRSIGAVPYEGQMYLGVLDPFVEMDITKDATFVNAASYSNITALYVAEIGRWMGVRWKRSNLIPIISLMAGNWLTITQTAPAGSGTGFAGNAIVGVKVTKVDPIFGFETIISALSTVTNVAAFQVDVTISSTNAPSGVYNVYVSLENGVAGTETFQRQVQHSAGVPDVMHFVKAGAPVAPTFVVKATGAIAPPDPTSAGNVHISYVFGRESFGVVDLGGLTTTITPSVPSIPDPLNQLRKVGWKQLFKAVIKNTSYFTRAESLSAFN